MVHSQVLGFCITSSDAPKTCPVCACQSSLQMTRDELDHDLRRIVDAAKSLCVSPKTVRSASVYQGKLSPAYAGIVESYLPGSYEKQST